MRPSTTRKRKGAALVEFAMVFPLFILLAVAAIDVGRAIMVKHKLVEAARAGCRLYILKDEPSEEDVTDIVDRVMAGADLQGHTVTMDPSSSNDIERLQPVTVSVSTAIILLIAVISTTVPVVVCAQRVTELPEPAGRTGEGYFRSSLRMRDISLIDLSINKIASCAPWGDETLISAKDLKLDSLGVPLAKASAAVFVKEIPTV